MVDILCLPERLGSMNRSPTKCRAACSILSLLTQARPRLRRCRSSKIFLAACLATKSIHRIGNPSLSQRGPAIFIMAFRSLFWSLSILPPFQRIAVMGQTNFSLSKDVARDAQNESFGSPPFSCKVLKGIIADWIF